MTLASIESVTRERCYVIAEIGCSHGGSVSTAKLMIDACAWAGVDAVKSQKRCLTPGVLFTRPDLDRPYDSPHAFGSTYGEHRAALELTIDEHRELRRYAHSRGVEYSVSVWDPVSLADAYAADMPWIKIPSACAVWHDLLRASNALMRPVLLSTGGLDDQGVSAALDCFDIVPWLGVMQCCSAYPAPVGASAIGVLSGWLVDSALTVVDEYGFSGHHIGTALDLAAVALGARVLERHVTLDKGSKGSDHAASLEPGELRSLVRDVRDVEEAMWSSEKRIHECEEEPMRKLRTAVMRGEA